MTLLDDFSIFGLGKLFIDYGEVPEDLEETLEFPLHCPTWFDFAYHLCGMFQILPIFLKNSTPYIY
jgi:hypothetical protein